MERDLLTYPTWERYTVLSHCISKLTIRDRRFIFQTARTIPSVSPDLFFPKYGFTLAEFAVWHTLKEGRRQHSKKVDVKSQYQRANAPIYASQAVVIERNYRK